MKNARNDTHSQEKESGLVASTDPTGPSFLDNLESNITRKKDKVFATWYDEKGNPANQYTFQEIWDEASIVAYDLRMKYKLDKGDRVVLCYNFGLQFFAAFLGCLRAGIVGVLIYPPSPRNLSKALPKMNQIIEDSNAKLVVVDSDVNHLRINSILVSSFHLWPKNIKFMIHPKKRAINTVNKQKAAEFLLNICTTNGKQSAAAACKDDLAFLQYTSGSTGDPKGVMVTYGSLQSNVESIIKAIHRVCKSSGFDYCKKDISSFSWLPQYHDMGLIYAMVAPFTAGWKCHLTSPLTFIKNPLIWIDLMSRLQVTWSVAPNFAFNLAVRKFNEKKANSRAGEEPIANLDLSSIVYLQNASEPIQAETKVLFEEAFGEYGLSQNWFMSGYGLAETVVYATDLHEYKLFQRNAGTKDDPSTSLVASGHRKLFPNDQVLKIVCPTTHAELGDGDIGEIWLSGPSITAGYFGRPELTNEVFHAKLKKSNITFLRTGDLGFFEDDYLYICGRQKDLIIVNGVNYYPQDIEHAVQGVSPAVRPGCVAAFSHDDTGNDGDLEVVFEIRKGNVKDVGSLLASIRTKIVEEIGLIPARVVAIRERSILKTTSGKIQRKATRNALHDNKFNIIDECVSSIYEDYATKGGSTTDGILDDGNVARNKFEVHFDSIMVSFFGEFYDSSRNWDELGLSSMASIQMRDAIADECTISLSSDCFDLYKTPEALKKFVNDNQGELLETSLPRLAQFHSTPLSWLMMGFLQGLCSIFLLFILAFPIVPAWYVGKWLARIHAFSTVSALDSNAEIVWIWVPIAVPIWMAALSLSVILLKWAVIWKYREGIIAVHSVAYLRWWFIDRAVALWEFWVGRFIKDTPLINLFYFLMGAKIPNSAVLDSFIRDFDLVSIGEHTSLLHSVNCHKFGKWDAVEGPYLRFRSISFGSNCLVKGMVSLGSSVNNGTLIEKLSVVPEGAVVPGQVRIRGNPALADATMNTSLNIHENKHTYWLGILKIVWLVIELYIFFGLTLLGQYLWFSRLPYNWRYAPVLGWFLLVIWFSTVSTLFSVVIKWVLIGKRRAGSSNHSLWRTYADWAADWHFGVSADLLYSISRFSRVWNVILWLHGMDIDFCSQVFAVNFSPSLMDLVTIRQSFLSVVSMSMKRENGYCYSEIHNSSIGLNVCLEPSENAKISNAIIPPLSHVTKSTTHCSPDERETVKFSSTCTQFKNESMQTVINLLSWGIIFCSLLPPYEVWMSCFGSPTSIWMTVPALASAFAIQTLSFVMLYAVVEYLALLNSEPNGKPWSKSLYSISVEMSDNLQALPFVIVVLGSPMYNVLVKMLGGKIKGRVILLPERLFEFSYLNFENRTIVESSTITGHHAVYNDITIGPSQISGILHEGNFAANACVDGSIENEPCWRAYVGSSQKKCVGKKVRESEVAETIFPVSIHTSSSKQEDIFDETHGFLPDVECGTC